jgi:transposase
VTPRRANIDGGRLIDSRTLALGQNHAYDLPPFCSVVAALQAMRGVAFVVAVTLVAEVGDFTRFASPRQLMAYLGLVPSEHSSGRTVQGQESPRPETLWRDVP